MTCKRVYVIIILLISTISAFSQHNSYKDSLRQAKRHSLYRSHQEDNVVKMSIVDWVSGNIPFYYERRFTHWLSAEVGLGLTTRDFTADLVNLYLNALNDDEGANPYAQYIHRKATVGVYASIQPKFYVTSDAITAFYLSPMLEFKRYDYKANVVDINSSSYNSDPVYIKGQYFPEHRNAIDFTIKTGWQWEIKRVAVEYSMGIGFRKFWEVRQDILTYDNGSSQGYINGIRSYSGYRPKFNLTVNLGGFF